MTQKTKMSAKERKEMMARKLPKPSPEMADLIRSQTREKLSGGYYATAAA